jgi:hypothetical protein
MGRNKRKRTRGYRQRAVVAFSRLLIPRISCPVSDKKQNTEVETSVDTSLTMKKSVDHKG